METPDTWNTLKGLQSGKVRRYEEGSMSPKGAKDLCSTTIR